MTIQVRNTTLLLLAVAIGTVSSPAFGQTANSPSPLLQGKNVTVYLEDADFGILAERFAYDSNARRVDIQDEKPKIAPKTSGVFSAVHFVNTTPSPVQPTSLKKMTPRPLGTNPSPRPLAGKPQKPAAEELSFERLSQVPLL